MRHGGVGGGVAGVVGGGGGSWGWGQSWNTPHCLFVHHFCFSACEVHSWCLTSPSTVTPAGQHRRLWDLPVTPASCQGAPVHLLASHHVDLLVTPASHNGGLQDLFVTPASHNRGTLGQTCDSGKS